MPIRESYPFGSPCWGDLPTAAPEEAEAFYGGLLGWEFEKNDPLFGEGARVATSRGRRVAGLVPAIPSVDVEPGWRTYFAVRSADALAARAQEEGGTVVLPPHDVGSAARTALIRDPAGNLFGVWQGARVAGAELTREPMTFDWSRLVTEDVPVVKEFYRVLFGFDTSSVPAAAHGPLDAFAIDYDLVAVISARSTFPTLAPQWLPCVLVADLDRSAETVVRLGGSEVVPRYLQPGITRVGVFSDPQGAVFLLLQRFT